MALVNERGTILSNEQVGPRLYLMSVESPLIAAAVQPGQFVHMKVPGMEGHILRRPFSIYASDASAGTVEILYQVVGFGSDHMTTLGKGAEPEMIGPVGHGWLIPEGTRRALVVGGGVGAAPLYMLCERLVAGNVRLDVVLGAQNHDSLVCLDRYTELLASASCCDDDAPRCATDDGSFGRAGFCTSLVQDALDASVASQEPYDVVYVCGPEPLMKVVSGLAADCSVPCQISMEKRMACGIGACLSCVVDTVDGKRRACVDGPVFEAQEVLW